MQAKLACKLEMRHPFPLDVLRRGKVAGRLTQGLLGPGVEDVGHHVPQRQSSETIMGSQRQTPFEVTYAFRPGPIPPRDVPVAREAVRAIVQAPVAFGVALRAQELDGVGGRNDRARGEGREKREHGESGSRPHGRSHSTLFMNAGEARWRPSGRSASTLQTRMAPGGTFSSDFAGIVYSGLSRFCAKATGDRSSRPTRRV